MTRFDVGIVGGGIGGAALGQYLARHGLRVLIAEREAVFRDRVRGEWMAPWGVAELKRLGLYERFLAAGGHHIRRQVGYDELLSAAEAEAREIPVHLLHPDIPGPLALEHVVMQNEALAAAADAGVDVRRGVSAKLTGKAGDYGLAISGAEGGETVACRWVVGADGRSSAIRRALGLTLNEAPLDHLIAGLLIDGADGWPEDQQSIGVFGDMQYLIFPQGNGKVRLYADYTYDGAARFNGENGAAAMLAAFDIPALPNSQAIARARPIGPCRSYPSQDAWVDEPVVEGALLIGDAGGYNDPILGQGLSVTLRDARIVGELFVGHDTWCRETFAPYIAERRERLRRLRAAAAFVTTLNGRYGTEDKARRERAFASMASSSQPMHPGFAAYVGPEALPAELFEPEYYEAVFGTRRYFVA
ncbi:MAG: FAD-dependent monooxygenase [Pseudomonadales bacterium]|nr:FAD-dependent monooxygenase [Pseudomonadales bacterium]MCP5185954.1 FAD-dependent monooxygenase [Pseudomonadales bacterium]